MAADSYNGMTLFSKKICMTITSNRGLLQILRQAKAPLHTSAHAVRFHLYEGSDLATLVYGGKKSELWLLPWVMGPGKGHGGILS